MLEKGGRAIPCDVRRERATHLRAEAHVHAPLGVAEPHGVGVGPEAAAQADGPLYGSAAALALGLGAPDAQAQALQLAQCVAPLHGIHGAQRQPRVQQRAAQLQPIGLALRDSTGFDG